MRSGGKYRRGFPHGLMFHRFHASGGRSHWQGALSSEEFDQILVYVGIDNILSPPEWIARLKNGRLRKDHLCITFDDGLRCQAEYALPVLDQYGLQAFWFVYSCVFGGIPVKSEIYSYVAGQIGGMPRLVEEFLSRCPSQLAEQLDSECFSAYSNRMRQVAPFYSLDDIKYRFLRNVTWNRALVEAVMDQIITERGFGLQELARRLWLGDEDLRTLSARGHHIGLHSYDHPYEMARLSRQEQQDQYAKNYSHLVSATGRPPNCMSHPLNSYNKDSLTILRTLGIQCGFRANVLVPSSAGINASFLELAREDSANLQAMMKQESG